MQHLNNKKITRKKAISWKVIIIAAAVIIIAGAAVAALLLMPGKKPSAPVAETVAVVQSENVGFLGVAENNSEIEAEKTVLISEVMPKNRATICDVDGDFPDYIELFNISDKSV